jgi:CTP synthase (UTP-ammonia lyase)
VSKRITVGQRSCKQHVRALQRFVDAPGRRKRRSDERAQYQDRSRADALHWIHLTRCHPLADFNGLWCIPGSPYRSMEGVLLAIRHAREQQRPFLGTCGGFQHALIEYARNVLNWSDVDHAESSPDAARAVIAPLACGLLNDFGSLRLIEGTRLAQAYGTLRTQEEYRCSYGVNPAFRAALVSGPLCESAVDESGDLRAIELHAHIFFVGTLFQPERAALRGKTPPSVVAFLKACLL